MRSFRSHGRAFCIWFGLILPGALVSGCAGVSMSGGGFSIGSSAIRTTGSIGGTGINLSGSTVTVGLSDGDGAGGGSGDSSGP